MNPADEPIRILIADDHEIVRRGLRALIENHPGWEACAEATDGRDAIEKVRELRPEMALLDVGMPHLNGLDELYTKHRGRRDNDRYFRILVSSDGYLHVHGVTRQQPRKVVWRMVDTPRACVH